MLYHNQNQACPEASSLLKQEAITYSVLMKILQGECAHIFTDMKNSIVCHSGSPWPVWAWCGDVGNREAVVQIAGCLKENFPVEQGFDCILSCALLEKLKETDAYFQTVNRGMELLSYRLDQLGDIGHPCEGSMGLVREEEIPSLISVWQDMHMEMEGRSFTREHCEQSIRQMVGEKSLFAWRNDAGSIVALTGRGDQEGYGKITSVYTLPDCRRKGYAINLVHGVTKTILQDGLVPILYTDADYAASNACYQKIGYTLVGQLTSIRK